MKDRLLKVLKYYNLTSTHFADEIGVQRSGISHILSGRNQPSFDFIAKMMKKYPDINPDWLIMGSGSMFRTNTQKQGNAEPGLFDKTDTKPVQHEGNVPVTLAGKVPGPERVTNVTLQEQIIIFYTDGTFKPYVPVSNE